MVAGDWRAAALRFCALLFGLVGIWGNFAAHAAPDRTPAICIARAQSGDSAKALWASPGRFACNRPQTDFGPGNYWVRIAVAPQSAPQGDRLVLRLVSMWQKSATVYFRYQDGSIASASYSAADAARHLSVGAIFEIPAPWRASAIDGVILHVRNSANVRGIVLAPELARFSTSARTQQKGIALYTWFIGVALTLLCYNLALWRAMRHRFQLYYCGMVAAMMLHICGASGGLVMIFPALNNITRMQFGYATLAMSAGFGLLFFQSFFETHVLSDRVRRASSVSVGLLWGCTAAFLALSSVGIAGFDRIYYYGYVPGVFAMMLLFISAARNKSEYLSIFLIAWAAPLLAGTLRWMHGVGYLHYNFWLDNSSIMAFGVEALISSAAISYRIAALSRERDQARAEERVARELARVDPLTGLLNRRGFLDAAIGREGLHCLWLLDIDRFKQVNDAFGHDQGDAVLQTMALSLRKWTPEGALIARLGGEEFAVLVAPRDAFAEANRLLAAIRNAPQPIGRPVTASIGLATGPIANEAEWRALYREVDAALYCAKREGRDRCVGAPTLRNAA